MARVIYNLPLPGGEIDGIRFTEDRGQLVSDEISEETAARLATIHGFQAIAIPAKTPASTTTPALGDGGPVTEQPLEASTDAPTEPRLTAAQKRAATLARKASENATVAQQQSGQSGQEGGEGTDQGQQDDTSGGDNSQDQTGQLGGAEGETNQKAEGTEGA